MTSTDDLYMKRDVHVHVHVHVYCALGDLHLYILVCVIYGCSQPRELWFIDLIIMYTCYWY